MTPTKRIKLEEDDESPGTSSTMSPQKYDNIYFGDNPIVHLKVGAKATLFYVHKGLICDSSPVFRAAFTGGFIESAGSMTLEEEDADIFGHIIQWLYRRKVETLSNIEEGLGHNYFNELCQLYVLADKYSIVALKNNVMHLLFEAFEKSKSPQADTVAYVYRNSVRGSQLRRFMVAYYVWQTDLDWYIHSNLLDWLERNQEFGAELVVAFALRAKGDPSPFQDRPSFQESCPDKPPS